MLSNIKTGIREGLINQHNKLYIDEDMPDYLPSLCWNIYMGERFIKKGNYKWIFSKKEIYYFSEDLQNATWIIDKENFKVIDKSPENVSRKVAKIIASKDKAYVDLAKDLRYAGVANYYIDQGSPGEGEAMLRKAIEVNPKSYVAYTALGHFYNNEGKYIVAKAMFKKAIEINPNYASAYHGLGNYDIHQGNFQEAESMFKKAIELDPNGCTGCTDLGRYYINQERYAEAEEILRKAIKLNPRDKNTQIVLEECYKKQGKYK